MSLRTSWHIPLFVVSECLHIAGSKITKHDIWENVIYRTSSGESISLCRTAAVNIH